MSPPSPLVGIHIGMGLVWLSTYAYFLDKLSAVLSQGRVRRALEGVMGMLLVGLGLRLAWERR